MEYFPISLDRTSFIITVLFWLMALLIGVAYFFVSPPIAKLVLSITALSMFAIAFCALALSPRGYAVGDGKLVVKRIGSDLETSVNDILKVKRLEHGELGRQLRTMGVGGLHGYFGYFRSLEFGPILYMSSRLDSLVLVERNGRRPLILSPKDPDKFVKAVRAL